MLLTPELLTAHLPALARVIGDEIAQRVGLAILERLERGKQIEIENENEIGFYLLRCGLNAKQDERRRSRERPSDSSASRLTSPPEQLRRLEAREALEQAPPELIRHELFGKGPLTQSLRHKRMRFKRKEEGVQ